MFFELRAAWHVMFTEEGQNVALSRRFVFQDSDKILELARKGGHSMNLEGRQAIDMGIAGGKGGVMLKLTPEQYLKLCRG
jgi:hypothetical protein